MRNQESILSKLSKNDGWKRRGSDWLLFFERRNFSTSKSSKTTSRLLNRFEQRWLRSLLESNKNEKKNDRISSLSVKRDSGDNRKMRSEELTLSLSPSNVRSRENSKCSTRETNGSPKYLKTRSTINCGNKTDELNSSERNVRENRENRRNNLCSIFFISRTSRKNRWTTLSPSDASRSSQCFNLSGDWKMRDQLSSRKSRG